MEILSKFQPSLIENKWYDYQINNNINQSKIDYNKESYIIVIQPPNIKGALHLGMN